MSVKPAEYESESESETDSEYSVSDSPEENPYYPNVIPTYEVLPPIDLYKVDTPEDTIALLSERRNMMSLFRQEDAEVMTAAMKWCAGQNFLMQNVLVRDIALEGMCTGDCRTHAVSRIHGIYVCLDHGRIHICGSEDCIATEPHQGYYLCVYSGRKVEMVIEDRMVNTKRPDDFRRIECMGTHGKWTRTRRRRKRAGDDNSLREASNIIETYLTGLFMDTEKRSRMLEVWRSTGYEGEFFIEPPPNAGAWIHYLTQVCARIWSCVEHFGQKTLLSSTCKNVTYNVLMRMIDRGLVHGAYRMLPVSPWLRKHLPPEDILEEVQDDLAVSLMQSGYRTLIEAFTGMTATDLAALRDALAQIKPVPE